AWAAYAISYSIPFWPIKLSLTINMSPWYLFQANLASCFWAVFPGALLWGASFPIGLAAVVRKDRDPGKMVGGMYAANTVGAIIGSLLFSMLIMQHLGSQNAQRLLLALCAISGLIAVIPVFGRVMSAAAGRPCESAVSPGAAAMLAVAILAAL